MKKLFFITALTVLSFLMVSCSNSSTTEPTTYDVPTFFAPEPETEVVLIPEFPELSKDFIYTALQFIDDLSDGNLATEAILQSNDFSDDLYSYLNYELRSNCIGENADATFRYWYSNGKDAVYSVKVWLHNSKVGTVLDLASFNNGPSVINGSNPLYISASILGTTYPDNITLAKARIASYVILHMDVSEVQACCIKKTNEGKEYYDFTFENEVFRDAAKGILQNLLES